MKVSFSTVSYDAAPQAFIEERAISGEEFFSVPTGTSGINVSEKTALTLPATLAAVNVLATDVALLPLRVYQKRSDGGNDPRPDHPVDDLLCISPDGETIPIVWKQALVSHALLYGGGYAEIQRLGRGRPNALHLLDPTTTKPCREGGRLLYELEGGRRIPPVNVLHVRGLGFDGATGYSFIKLLKGALGIGLAQQSYTSDFFANGSDPGGWVEVPQKLSPEAQSNLRVMWEQIHRGPGNRHRVGVLEQGATYKPNGIDPSKSQLLESRKFQLLEVGRPWRLPPHKLGDYSESHLANIEASNLDYLTTALMPWLVAIEQEFTFKLFSPAEIKAGYYVEHNVAALLRGDIVSRFNAYHQALADGWMNRDEVRSRENLSPIGEEMGGRKYLVQVNQTTLETIGEDETTESPAVDDFEETNQEEATSEDMGPDGSPVEVDEEATPPEGEDS